jgi:hypothetical protein
MALNLLRAFSLGADHGQDKRPIRLVIGKRN